MNKEYFETRTEYRRSSTLVDYYRVLFKWKKSIVMIFVSVVLLSVLTTIIIPSSYESVASVLLRPGRENSLLDPITTLGEVTTVRRDLTTEINSEIQIIKSRDIANTTVTNLGVEYFEVKQNYFLEKFIKMVSGVKNVYNNLFGIFNYNKEMEKLSNTAKAADIKLEKVINGVMSNLRCDSVPNSNIIMLKYRANEPEKAQAILKDIVKNYLDKHMSVNRVDGTYEFFKNQTDTLLESIKDTEKKLEDVKSEAGVTSLEKQRVLLIERIDILKRTVADYESDLAASKEKNKTLENSLTNVPERLLQEEISGAPTSAVEELRKRIYELKLEESELLSKFSNESVPVLEIRRQIETAQELLNTAEKTDEVTSGVNTTYKQIELDIMREKANINSLKEKINSTKMQLKITEKELDGMNKYEQQIVTLNREYQISEENYRKYNEGKEQARIDNALENDKISNVSMAQKCTLPIEPISPKKGIIIAFGIFVGLFSSLGVAFFREYIDHSFSTPDEIEQKLGITSLGHLPIVELGNKKIKKLSYNEKIYLSEDSIKNIVKVEKKDELMNVPDESNLIENRQKTEMKQEEKNEKHDGKIIAVTSSRKGEGVSTFAVYFSSMLRNNMGKKVLLIDTNFDDPSIHKILNCELSPGLGELLMKKTRVDVLQRSKLYDFDCLTAGKFEMNPLWENRKNNAYNLLEKLKNKYDYVVLDTSAIWSGNGVKKSGFESIADGVILVVEAEKIKWEIAIKSKEKLKKMNANILGVILNKRRFHIPDWLYQRI